MSKSRFDKIPDEAQRILLIEALPDRYGPWIVSSKEYDRILAVKRKYPHLFPWQAKYDSIPKEVHEAYKNEFMDVNGIKLNEWFNPDDLPLSNGGGIFENMKFTGVKSSDVPTDFKQAFKNYYEMEAERERKAEERRKKDEALWDRHYKKYGLKYKG